MSGVLDEVVRVGDVIDGAILTDLELGSDAFWNDSIAFMASRLDRADSVYVSTCEGASGPRKPGAAERRLPPGAGAQLEEIDF